MHISSNSSFIGLQMYKSVLLFKTSKLSLAMESVAEIIVDIEMALPACLCKPVWYELDWELTSPFWDRQIQSFY